MRRRSVSGNTSPNAGFLLVPAESGSSTEVSPRFHYAQAQCFQALFENTVQCGILVPQDRAVRMKLTCPGVSQPRPPISMLMTAGFGSSRKTMSLKLMEVIIEIGGVGGESVQEVVWIHSLARCVLLLWIEAGKGIWIQQGFGRLIRRPLQYAIGRGPTPLHVHEVLL